MGSEESVCSVCGQSVETVVGRHKTLGAWVPVWGPGPCRNPDCPAFAAAVEPEGSSRSAGRAPDADRPPDSAPGRRGGP